MSDTHFVDLHLTDREDATCVYEAGDVQLMRLRLEPGKELGSHNSIADLLMIPIEGGVRFESGDTCEVLGPGQALAIPYDTPMDLSNAAEGVTNVLILKTPPGSKTD